MKCSLPAGMPVKDTYKQGLIDPSRNKRTNVPTSLCVDYRFDVNVIAGCKLKANLVCSLAKQR